MIMNEMKKKLDCWYVSSQSTTHGMNDQMNTRVKSNRCAIVFTQILSKKVMHKWK